MVWTHGSETRQEFRFAWKCGLPRVSPKAYTASATSFHKSTPSQAIRYDRLEAYPTAVKLLPVDQFPTGRMLDQGGGLW